jgi:outer membrane lipoprotein
MIMNYSTTGILGLLLSAIVISGCASKVPEFIRTPPPGDIRVDEVQESTKGFIDSKIRWGGSIISVRNLADETHIEVLSVKLNKSGKPRDNSKSRGRFIARIKGFLEPEEYPKDRLITVIGHISGLEKQPVGSYDYPYPIVDVEGFYLWPEETPYYPQHTYDPFYNPYFYPYPYWRRYPYYW